MSLSDLVGQKDVYTQLAEAKAQIERLKKACSKEFESVQTLDAENTRLKLELRNTQIALHEAKLDHAHGIEGRRLFNLCLNHGAISGQVHQWLKQRLEDTSNGIR